MDENADDPILDPLNDQQRKAVEHTEGPLLILAGAGTGKTRTMTHRIAYLIDRVGVPPDRILGVTFTNKAADEMAERTLKMIPDAVVQPELRTFHSWGNRFLREEVEHDFFDFKRPFTIYDQEQQKALLKDIIKDATGIDKDDHKPSGVISFISKRKADLETADMYQKRDNLDREGRELGHLYSVYQEELRDNNAVDFGDLIMLPVLLMKNDPDVCSFYQNSYDYLMVDEFQDTNYAQYQLTYLLGKQHQNVAVVGDDDQCLIEGTKITLPDGEAEAIEDIEPGDKVLSNYGSGDLRPSTVTDIHKETDQTQAVRITTPNNTITSTPEHIHFAGYELGPSDQQHFVYLMKSGERYRLGTSRVYTGNEENPTAGFKQRTRQEHADASWVVGTHDNEQQARLQEEVLSLQYQLPTLPFQPRDGNKNGLVDDQQKIDQVFQAVDTRQGAKKLMNDFGLFEAFPHYNAAPRNSNRRNITFTMCSDRRSSSTMHRVVVSGNDEEGRSKLEANGFSVQDRYGDRWRLQACRSSYHDASQMAQELKDLLDGTIIEKGRLGVNPAGSNGTNSLLCMPASSVRSGMTMFDEDGNYQKVKNVEFIEVSRPFYDLEVDNTHNFIANGAQTHNSIYSWRGADVNNILNRFEKDFPGTETVKLEQNYRSTGAILDAAYDVIKNQEERKDKKMWTEREDGDPPAVRRFKDEQEEARFIRRRIDRLVEHEGYNYGDFGILVRMTAQTRPLEEQFLKNDVPYVVIGSMRFLERKEIKDIMAYLYMIVNPEDESSFKRVINTPTRGIGSKTEEMVFDYADTNDCSPITAIRKLTEKDDIGGRARNSLQGFYDLYRDLREAAAEKTSVEIIEDVLEKTKYMDEEVRKKDDEEMVEQRAGNIDELINMAQRYQNEALESGTGSKADEQKDSEQSGAEQDEGNAQSTDDSSANGNKSDDAEVDEGDEEGPTLSGFLTELTLYSDVDVNEPQDDAVNVMTYHAAKGLEFPVVFLPGLEQGILPHSRSIGRPSALAEERRLCYVGLTRAEDQLYCTLAKRRFMHGSSSSAKPSEFLKEADLWADEDERKRRQRQNDEDFLSDTDFGSSSDSDATDQTEDNSNLSSGDWVRHEKLGKGKILRIMQQGSNEIAVVDFQNDSQSERKLSLDHAPLDPADPPF